MHGQENDTGLRTFLFNNAGHFERRGTRHADIHKNEIGTVLKHQFQRVGRIGGLGDDFKIRLVLQQTIHSMPKECVVVGDDTTDRGASCCEDWGSFLNQNASSAARTKQKTLCVTSAALQDRHSLKIVFNFNGFSPNSATLKTIFLRTLQVCSANLDSDSLD